MEGKFSDNPVSGYGRAIGKKSAMKLSRREIKQVSIQMQAEPIPGDHPALPHLKTYIGDHTFYIGSEGVFIWEYADGDGEEDKRINALRVASWADPGKLTVAMHKPQLTETAIKLSEGGGTEDELPRDGLPKDELTKEEITKDDAKLSGKNSFIVEKKPAL